VPRVIYFSYEAERGAWQKWIRICDARIPEYRPIHPSLSRPVVVMSAVFLTYIIGDLIAIPFSYLFSKK